jgi:hypothetical protein
MLKVSIMQITDIGFQLKKEICILNIIKELVPGTSWVKRIDPKDFIKEIDIQIAINN